MKPGDIGGGGEQSSRTSVGTLYALNNSIMNSFENKYLVKIKEKLKTGKKITALNDKWPKGTEAKTCSTE